MTINEIRCTIQKEAERRGYFVEERKSTSSDSWYFKLYAGTSSLMFRVADHKTKTAVVTLRLDRRLSPNMVKSFVRNRCNDLRDRRLKSILGA